MVDTYNNAKVVLVSEDFIKKYESEHWNSFKAERSHKGIVSVAGWV